MANHATSPVPALQKTSEASPGSLDLTEAPAPFWRILSLDRVVSFARKPWVLLLILVALVVSRGITKGEFYYYGDEMYHAMNGVFFRDFLTDLPLQHPLQYAYEYYAKYPAIAFPHWPPLFHFIEGVFFAVFGLSPWVGRLAVLGFTLLAAYFWYRIAEDLGPRHRAWVTGIILICLPFVLTYTRVAMLEIPVLAACLGGIYFWMKFLKTGSRGALFALAGFAIGGVLISEKAIFLAFFVVIDLIVERQFKVLKRADVWLGLAACVAAVLPWYILASRTLNEWSERAIGNGLKSMALPINYTFYLTRLYRQLGPFLLCLACLGIVIALWKCKRNRANRFFLNWVFSGYLCFLLISEKDPRHTMLWVPPLIYLAVLALERLLVRRVLAVTASVLIALVYFVGALRTERGSVTGAKGAAQYVLSLPESDIVYYQGFLDGDFVFNVRRLDPEKQHMVAREKQVFAAEAATGKASPSPEEEQTQILNFFQTWGIRYALIENEDPYPGLSSVRLLLSSDQFELLRTFPVSSNLPRFQVRQIQVFRFRGELHRTNQPVRIPMGVIRNDILADLSRLAGRPWPN